MKISNRVFWAGVFLAGCSILSFGGYAKDSSDVQEVVKARKVLIVDNDGRTRISLQSLPKSGPQVTLRGERGQNIANIGQDRQGASLLLGSPAHDGIAETGSLYLVTSPDDASLLMQEPTSTQTLMLVSSKKDGVKSSITFFGPESSVEKVVEVNGK